MGTGSDFKSPHCGTSLAVIRSVELSIDSRDRIRKVVRDHAGLGPNFETIDYSTDLYRAGMTSYSSVVLMIALENEFDLEFPDGMLSRSVFESIDSIANAIESLHQEKP